jgi:septal ring factor EnvC (AmiA/AmiB activator)
MRVPTCAALVLASAVLLVGCGREIARENEQLKTQVSTMQKESQELRGQVASLKGDLDAVKKQVETLTREKQELEEKIKLAEAKAAVKPGTKPPLKPRKSS